MIFDKIGAIRITPARFFGFWATLFTLVLSAISLENQVINEKVHEKVHETTPKVRFPGSFF